jgi:hypothetical protein
MIILGLVLLSVSLFTVFQSEDGLDFSRALLRVLLSCLVLVYAKFEEQRFLETVVLFFGFFLLGLFAIMRKEVQVNHDES